MNGNQPEDTADGRLSSTDEIEYLCAEFSWESSGGGSQVAAWLERAPVALRRVAFRRLLGIELAQRYAAGDTPRRDEYQRQFPEFHEDVDFAFSRLTDIKNSESNSVSLDSTIIHGSEDVASTGRRDPQPGDVIGRYVLEHCVGSGGFGVVWKAFDPELDRLVAIKLARPDKSFSELLLEQTRDEARKAAAVTHPGIVPVYDVVRCEGYLAIISEFISGETLHVRMQSKRIPQNEVIEIVIQIARALHHAHTQGLVHRDVKPGNVLLRKNGDAVLTDFGLAVSEIELLTEPAGFVGTRKYMSPEQARGESNRVDPRSDVFSLGVVLYQLITGRFPWIGTTPEEYVDQLLKQNPRLPRTLDDSIDPELERICLKCLEKTAGDRYTTANELERDLTALKSRSSTDSAPSKAHSTGRRILVAALVLMVVTIAAFAIPKQAPLPPDEIPEPPNGANVNPFAPPEQAAVKPPEPDPQAWRSLLTESPTIFSYPQGDGREKPVFDAEMKRYSVHAERMRWIATTGETDSKPFEVRAVVHVENWIGHAGIIWGLRDDPEAFPAKQKRCLCVEYMRVDEHNPPYIWVREMFISPRNGSFDDWRVHSKKTVDSLELEIPEKSEVPLKITVKNGAILVHWDDRKAWQPDNSFRKADFLPPGKTEIGITGGFGSKSQITDLSLRYLP